jgi:hypothetical protein
MAERFTLTYYYVSPKDAFRIEALKKCMGDSEKMLVTQYIRAWLSRNRDYYLDLARFDAHARGISLSDWGKIITAQGIEFLPAYQKELKAISPSPLRDIVLSPDARRKPINYITLGLQNLAFLRVAIHYDRDNAIGFVSRIIKEHLDRNWEKLYAPQVEADHFDNWK